MSYISHAYWAEGVSRLLASAIAAAAAASSEGGEGGMGDEMFDDECSEEVARVIGPLETMLNKKKAEKTANLAGVRGGLIDGNAHNWRDGEGGGDRKRSCRERV